MEKTIRGIVYSQYKSARAFAKAVKWDRNKACKIISGEREPRLFDVQEMANVLDGYDAAELALIFLKSKSQMCDKAG